MKKTMFTVMVFLLAIGVAYAGQDVRNSKHNLSSAGTLSPYQTTSTDRVCVFCHTPHFAASGEAPLWNRTLPNTTGYTMYSSATIDMTINGVPQGVSLACLSCHDGTVAFDALVNKPGSGIGAPSGWTWNTNGNIMTLTTSPSAMVGQDLSNDHPISITYDTTKDTAFNTLTNGKVGTLPLYGSAKNQVECGSCHDPHQGGAGANPTFLRIANTGSALCLTCHVK